MPRVTISIVSHRQNALVNALLGDLAAHCGKDLLIALTENVPDAVSFATGPFGDRIQVISNRQPKGFGANHNSAFARCGTPFYCVANPDIRLSADPFPALLDPLRGERPGVAGPLVRGPTGNVEDSARRFPTLASLLCKVAAAPSGPEYPVDQGPVEVDWMAGMFMLFSSQAYRSIGGFDERYFLYYEDADICRRLHAGGKAVVFQPLAEVRHDARRGSHVDPRLAIHHLASAARFLSKR